ncbi:helix-turn-helix domain-containing protein [Paracoccus sp. P2]|uniref:Helix-turn-helix domain-containing protein n=1 Tax=Paracoccus pantotrophus TaxID=82367 RepID=A0A7H9BUK4_PARPN|nr:helix-turn-helix domain-containing protein [Paracoccus pantotrophus]QLH15027.1 helix-turn-helix domain-containing protein [Paracoccus pantotrophus]
MGKHEPAFAPRLLPAPEAAHYLGISETKLRSLGLPRRMLGGKRLYDRLALDEYASGLPIEGEDVEGVNTCDEILRAMR